MFSLGDLRFLARFFSDTNRLFKCIGHRRVLDAQVDLEGLLSPKTSKDRLVR